MLKINTHSTALMYAADSAKKEALQLLIVSGANPNIRNKRGNTTLTLAEKSVYFQSENDKKKR